MVAVQSPRVAVVVAAAKGVHDFAPLRLPAPRRSSATWEDPVGTTRSSTKSPRTARPARRVPRVARGLARRSIFRDFEDPPLEGAVRRAPHGPTSVTSYQFPNEPLRGG